jgi:hypothetical protein
MLWFEIDRERAIVVSTRHSISLPIEMEEIRKHTSRSDRNICSLVRSHYPGGDCRQDYRG